MQRSADKMELIGQGDLDRDISTIVRNVIRASLIVR